MNVCCSVTCRNMQLLYTQVTSGEALSTFVSRSGLQQMLIVEPHSQTFLKEHSVV